jgi:hypothetical protein
VRGFFIFLTIDLCNAVIDSLFDVIGQDERARGYACNGRRMPQEKTERLEICQHKTPSPPTRVCIRGRAVEHNGSALAFLRPDRAGP